MLTFALQSTVLGASVATLLLTVSYIGPQFASHLLSAALILSPMTPAPSVAAFSCHSEFETFFTPFWCDFAVTALATPAA